MKKLSFLIATALCIMACSGGSDEQPDGPVSYTHLTLPTT